MDRGWGISKTNSGAFRAQKCNLNNYGTNTKVYGLAVNPCKNCPIGTQSLQISWTNETVLSVGGVEVAIRDGANDTLYIHPLSCVTLPGYGEPMHVHERLELGRDQGSSLRQRTVAGYGPCTEQLAGIAG